MKKTLILLALAGLTVAAACGDDGDDKTVVETKPDAGGNTKPDSGVVIRPVQITNLGSTCEDKSDCQGPGATCETKLGEDENAIELEGGFCTAQCNDTAECGATGGCLVSEIRNSLPTALKDLAAGFSDIIPSSCLLKCDVAGTACRTGYECKSIKDRIPPALANNQLAAGLLAGPAFAQTYGVPPLPAGDGGVPDAGLRALVVSGIDAGL